MPKLAIDFGNADIKWLTGDGETGYARHALAFLSERQWDEIVGARGKLPPAGYYRVNGVPVVVGDKARRHVIKDRPRGAARYTREYYGVGLAVALAEGLRRASRKVAVYASHAPQDIRYAADLRAAATGDFLVLSSHGEQEFAVVRVETFDEPLGGFNHFVLTSAGRERRDNPVRDKTVLVLDVGGYTVDAMAVDAGGDIDPSTLGSTRTGVIAMLDRFEQDLRAKHRDLFREVGNLDPKRVESALQSGYYAFGKLPLDVVDEAHGALQLLVNDVLDIVRANGGIANYDIVLLTGGGAALIFEPLRRSLPHIDCQMVESDREMMRYANVLGGMKLFALLERMGAL